MIGSKLPTIADMKPQLGGSLRPQAMDFRYRLLEEVTVKTLQCQDLTCQEDRQELTKKDGLSI